MYYSTCRNRMRQEIFYIKISRTSVTKIPKMDPVNGTVDHQRHYRQGKCNPCDLHTPKCCQQYLSNGKEKICKPDDRQVGHSCLNDRLICCKKPKQLSRKKLASINRIRAIKRPVRMAQALIFLTGCVSFFPQYWLPNMTSPSPSAISSC